MNLNKKKENKIKIHIHLIEATSKLVEPTNQVNNFHS